MSDKIVKFDIPAGHKLERPPAEIAAWVRSIYRDIKSRFGEAQ